MELICSECVCMYKYMCWVLSSTEWLKKLCTLGSCAGKELRGKTEYTKQHYFKLHTIVPIKLFSTETSV